MSSFLARAAPSDVEFVRCVDGIWGSRADLRAAFQDRSNPEFQKWLCGHGRIEYPDQLGPHFPPLPGAHLRMTACGGTAEIEYLKSGLDDAGVLHELAAVYVDPDERVRTVLDLGCACGRLARWLPAVFPKAEVHGADVRAAAIEWCQASLPGTFVTNEIAPPLPFPDDHFDVIVSLSVFTHLSRESNDAWIRELTRVCKPDGRIIVTMLGSFALFVISRFAENQAFFFMSRDVAYEYLRRLHREHWILHAMPDHVVAAMDGVEASYGQVFNDEVFVRTVWAPYVEVVGTLPAGLCLFQDYFILKPRG